MLNVIHKFNFIWRPKLTITALALFTILVYLGTWQLERSKHKETLATTLKARLKAEPVPLATVANMDIEDNRFILVNLDGVFLNNFTMLLDNQIYKHQVGYRVLTPVQAPALDKWVLIDRGWIAAGSSRDKLPVITDIFGVKQIVGIITTIPSGLTLQDDPARAAENWPLVMQNVDYELITAKLHHQVYEFVVRLQDDTPSAYQIMPLEFGVSKDKHLGYALQWFTFAGLLIIYYLFACLQRKT
jgi:surfeit locus 1 family protein